MKWLPKGIKGYPVFKVGDIVVEKSLKKYSQPWIITEITPSSYDGMSKCYGYFINLKRSKQSAVYMRELDPAPRISEEMAKLIRMLLL